MNKIQLQLNRLYIIIYLHSFLNEKYLILNRLLSEIYNTVAATKICPHVHQTATVKVKVVEY